MKFSEIQIFLNFHMPNMFGKVKPTNGWTNLNTVSTKKLWLQEFKKYKFSSSLLCLHLYQVTFRFITLVCMILNHCALRCTNRVVKSKKFLTPHFFCWNGFYYVGIDLLSEGSTSELKIGASGGLKRAKNDQFSWFSTPYTFWESFFGWIWVDPCL